MLERIRNKITWVEKILAKVQVIIEQHPKWKMDMKRKMRLFLKAGVGAIKDGTHERQVKGL